MTNTLSNTPLRDEFRHTYIIGKALHVAIQEMSNVPKPFQEVSDIKDMQTLIDQIYNMFPTDVYDETLKAVSGENIYPIDN